MKKTILLLCLLLALPTVKGSKFNDGYIQYKPLIVSDEGRQEIAKSIRTMDKRYDPESKMLTTYRATWNYHTDRINVTYHEVRSSLYYALALLDLGNAQSEQRAFDVLRKTISLQTTDQNLPFCGVWPYYEEEPLVTKKSPVDYNWADFNVVTLLSVYMDYNDRLPLDLKRSIKDALILGAHSIEKRNCLPSYTNIAIMGTYCTYMVSHLFDISDLKEYAHQRLVDFYNYTKRKQSFTEYNSPTYTIVALNELDRMRRHMIEPIAANMISELYEMCWEVVARHFHMPTAQWAGPSSRSYSSLTREDFYILVERASNGRIDFGIPTSTTDVRSQHYIPEKLYPYFLSPTYPRLQISVFEPDEPQIIGTTYLTDSYVISSVNHSSFWNQRRPLLAYWGEPMQKSNYLQIRFLHENYDFCTAFIKTSQKNNKLASIIYFVTDGGDKHINIDRLTGGKFKATDLRLRLELGNCKKLEATFPKLINSPFNIIADGMNIIIQLPYFAFGNEIAYWEKGRDKKHQWIDLVIYKGQEKKFDLTTMTKAVVALVMNMEQSHVPSIKDVNYKTTKNELKLKFGSLKVTAPTTAKPRPDNL